MRHPWERYLFGLPVARWPLALVIPVALRRAYRSHRQRRGYARLRAARAAWRIVNPLGVLRGFVR